jgi:hypothetical protein
MDEPTFSDEGEEAMGPKPKVEAKAKTIDE